MNKKYRIILAFGFCLCPLLIVTGCDIEKAKYQRTENLSVPLAPGSNLVAETSFGSITITGADVADCNITAIISVKAPTEEEAKEIAEKVKIKPELVGKTLTVKAEKPQTKKKRSISVSFNITVPEQTNVECSTSFGAIKLANINGNVKGKTSFGSITSSELTGNSLKLKSNSGNINLTEASATTTDIFTSFGRITCHRITSADLTAKSSSGSIDIACLPSAPPEINANVVTSFGSIDFVAPPNFAGQVDLSTSFGSIKTDLPITITGEVSKKKLTGKIGEGKGKLHLQTNSGSIRIK